MSPPDSSAETALDEYLVRELQQTQHDFDQIVRGGRWLAWSCIVTGLATNEREWEWSFRPDVSPVLPEWFDIDLAEGESLSVALRRSRVACDHDECDSTAERAIREGAPGYTQLFRMRLRDGRMSWVEENVVIQQLDRNKWHLVGICIDATERVAAEERLNDLQDELCGKQTVLIAQNAELESLRDRLEAEKHALAAANERLEALATTDGLTGIKNHRAFQEQLEHEWAAACRYRTTLSLIILDIDHFKLFNDTFGHPAGDQVLKAVGEILSSAVRATDCLARYGGEEFVAILPQTDSAGGLEIAERFRVGIESHGWLLRPITASLGVATRRAGDEGAESILSEADRALYRAKSAGRNCTRLATPCLTNRAA